MSRFGKTDRWAKNKGDNSANNSANVVKLVNLETADVIICDPYVLREQCLPEGYRLAEDVTVEEWIEALKRAKHG